MEQRKAIIAASVELDVPVELHTSHLDKNSLPIGGYETCLHTKLSTETFLAVYEMQKYTDIRLILPYLNGVATAGTENRMDKVQTLQLEGYRKFDYVAAGF